MDPETQSTIASKDGKAPALEASVESTTTPPTRDDQPMQGRPPPCPRCKFDLTQASRDSIPFLGCGQCGGVWLDAAACHALLGDAALKLKASAPQDEGGQPEPNGSVYRTAPPAPHPENPARCPTCASPLVRTRVGGTRETVDTCSVHGTWFDPDELRLIAQAFTIRTFPSHFSASPKAYGDSAEWRFFSAIGRFLSSLFPDD